MPRTSKKSNTENVSTEDLNMSLSKKKSNKNIKKKNDEIPSSINIPINDVLLKIKNEKDLSTNDKHFLTNFFLKNFNEPFIDENKYNTLISNIIKQNMINEKLFIEKNKTKHITELLEEKQKQKFRFRKNKNSVSIPADFRREDSDVEKIFKKYLDLEINNSEKVPSKTLPHSLNGFELLTNKNIQKNLSEKASLHNILSFYLYKISKNKNNDNFIDKDNKCLLPINNESNYFYSYIVIQLTNNVVKLVPILVKIDKYLNFKNKYFENEELHYSNLNKEFSFKNVSFLKKTFLTSFRNKFSKYFDESKNKDILFNDTQLYTSIFNNSILEYIHFQNDESKNYILNNFLKIFDIIDNESICFNMIDTDYISQFYNFYLQLYGEKNIKSIKYVWDLDNLTLTKDSGNNQNNIKNMVCSMNILTNRNNDFSENIVGFYNLEKYLFKENEIQQLKDMFPYRFENCLSYSFSNYNNLQNILSIFTLTFEVHSKRNLLLSMMGDKNDNLILSNEINLWELITVSTIKNIKDYLLKKIFCEIEINFNERKILSNQEFLNILDIDLNTFDKEELLTQLYFLKTFSFEQFILYLESLKNIPFIESNLNINYELRSELFNFIKNIDIEYIEKEKNNLQIIYYLIKIFVKYDGKYDEYGKTNITVQREKTDTINKINNKMKEKINEFNDICVSFNTFDNDGFNGLCSLTSDDEVNNLISQLNVDNSIEGYNYSLSNLSNNIDKLFVYNKYIKKNENDSTKIKFPYKPDENYIEELLKHKILDNVSTYTFNNNTSILNDNSSIFNNESSLKQILKNNYLNNISENKVVDNTHTFIFYNNSTKQCNVFKYILSNNEDNLLTKSIFEFFDIFYANDFSRIAILKNSEINVSFETIYNDFLNKQFPNRSNATEYYNFVSKNYIKEVVVEKKEVEYSIQEYVSIIRTYYHIDTNIENRVRSSELSTKMIDIINNHIKNENKYINEDHFISKFSEIASELGLSKKRYSSGNYYYGIREKQIGNNIFDLLNNSEIIDKEKYESDILKEISKMEEKINNYKISLTKDKTKYLYVGDLKLG